MPFVGIDERNVTLGKVVRMLLDECHATLQGGDFRALAPYVGLAERVLNRDGAGDYDHRDVTLEGLLRLQLVPAHLPMECVNEARCLSPFRPFLVGTAETETGASNIGKVNEMLRYLNGREVRVTIEWKGGPLSVERNLRDDEIATPPCESLPCAGGEVQTPGRADGGHAQARGDGAPDANPAA